MDHRHQHTIKQILFFPELTLLPSNMAPYQHFFFSFFGDKTKSNVTDSSYKGIFCGNKQMRQNLRILKFPIIWRVISVFLFNLATKQNPM